MSNLNFQPDQIGDYHVAIVALSLLCIAVLIQAFLAGVIGLSKAGGELPGAPLQGNHASLSFRVLRTYGNSVENLPAFGLCVFLAILGSANSALVNWLAALHVGARLAFWAIYYSGVGKVAGGPRTISYVLGWFINLILALTAFVSLLS